MSVSILKIECLLNFAFKSSIALKLRYNVVNVHRKCMVVYTTTVWFQDVLMEMVPFCKSGHILYLYSVHDLTSQILQKHSESLSQLLLPMEVVQTLYTEGVISKETYDEVEKSGGCLGDGPLRALHNTICRDPNHLKVFASVLLRSEETVHVAKHTLKDYSKYKL